ncbi:MAG: heme A synthase [Halodesulfurarchaeum sp.]
MTRGGPSTSGALLDDRLPYRYLAGATLLVTFIVMVLGSYTSAIGAGLSCPDWPTCYGSFIPWLHPEVIENAPYTTLQIFAEWFHRGMAMVAGFLILGTAIGSWRAHREHGLIRWTATLALVLLPLQVILGGLTVTENLAPFIVTSHLAVAILILLLLTVSTLSSWFVTTDLA